MECLAAVLHVLASHTQSLLRQRVTLMYNWWEPFVIPLLLLSLPVAFIMCFWGYRAFKLILAIIAGTMGWMTAYALILAFIYRDPTHPLVWIGSLVCGIVVGLAAVQVYLLGVFLHGTAIGVFITAVISLACGEDPNWPVALIVGAAAGALAVSIRVQFIIISSVLAGASYFTLKLGTWIAAEMGQPAGFLGGTVVFLSFAILGYLKQNQDRRNKTVQDAAHTESEALLASKMAEQAPAGQWRCRCGDMNRTEFTHCKRCGRVPNAVI